MIVFRVPETWWYLVILHFNYVKNDEDMLFFHSRHNDISPSAFEKNIPTPNVEKRKMKNFYLYLLLALELKGAKKTRFYVGYPIPFTMSTLSRDIIKVFTPSQKKSFLFLQQF